MRVLTLAVFALLPGCFFLGECVPPDEAVLLTVLDADGNPVDGVEATSSLDGGDPLDCTVDGNLVHCGAGADGAGTYDVVITAPGFESKQSSFEVESASRCGIDQQVADVVLDPSP